MDTVIQGLTQSAIVQKLSETEHNVKRFLKDIPDNTPYISFSKTQVSPFMGARLAKTGAVRFKIQRRGYLNRMYLRMNVQLSNDIEHEALRNGDIGVATFHNPVGSEFFANFFESCSLFIGGKRVETLYPENVLYHANSNTGPAAASVLHGLRGKWSVTNFAEVEEAFRNYTDGIQDVSNLQRNMTFLIPLDFSFFKFFKDSLDTNFLPKMEVEFVRKQVDYYMDAISPTIGTEAVLRCMYHTLHNHFRNNIRNTNFERETSTQITNGNHLLTVEPLEEIVTGPFAHPNNSRTTDYGRKTYKMDLDLFATDILISFRRGFTPDEVQFTDNFVGNVRCVPRLHQHFRVILRANGRELFNKLHFEMNDFLLSGSSHEIQDNYNAGESNNIGAEPKLDGARYITGESSTSNPYGSAGNHLQTHRKQGLALYTIPLTMFGTDEFLNGGLNMKHLANCELILEGQNLLPFEYLGEDYLVGYGMVPQIVIRHKTLTRIDGKTGVVAV